MSEMAEMLYRIADRISIPILVDADSGFGNALNIARTVRTFERAGASGIQIEGQVNTKPMADVGRRPLISTEAMVGKIHAALDARAMLAISRKNFVFPRAVKIGSAGASAATICISPMSVRLSGTFLSARR
jgi:2-methylisocitrate lyase-like PEP mutase family enzyme